MLAAAAGSAAGSAGSAAAGSAAGTAAISAGGGVLSTMLQHHYNKQYNEDQREFAREMYEKQKQDNIDFWNMQNSYNDPKQQMTRLQQAGLNPNMVYDKGAQNTAGAIAPSKPISPNSVPTQINPAIVSNAIHDYMSVKKQQAEIDNLYKQGQLMDEDRLLKAAQGGYFTSQMNLGKYDLTFKQGINDYAIRAYKNSVLLEEMKAQSERMNFEFLNATLKDRVYQSSLNTLTQEYNNALTRAKTALTAAERDEARAHAGLLRQQMYEAKANMYLTLDHSREIRQRMGHAADEHQWNRMHFNNYSNMFNLDYKAAQYLKNPSRLGIMDINQIGSSWMPFAPGMNYKQVDINHNYNRR